MTRPLLTIAIPTYNRVSCLKELLKLLADQVRDEPRVELIVSDNASADETSELIEDFLARGVPLRYIRNPENIGADANFLQCFEQARGKYLWLFGDDDLILPGAVAAILSYCERDEYDLIWVNSYALDSLPDIGTFKPKGNAVEFTSARAYTKRIHIFFTFISGNIINRDTVLNAGPMSFSSLVGTSLIQLGWAYTALRSFRRGLYIKEKLTGVRINNTGGYKLFHVFGATLEAITQEWLRSKELGQIIVNGTLQRFWPSMLLEYKNIAHAFTDQTPPQEVLTPLFRDNARYWIFAFPVIVLPVLLARMWVLAVRVVNRVDKALGYPLLQWGVADESEHAKEKAARPGNATLGG